MSSKTIVDIDLLKYDKKSIDTQKVIFAIWKNRKKPAVVADIIRIFSAFFVEKQVLLEVEFYLPQLSHLIIHLDSCSQPLEYLAVALSQSSMHTALQLNYILIAALEDYQKELSSGEENPSSNFIRYFRCARMLHNLERAVIFGSPILTSEEKQKLAQKTQASHEKIARLYELEMQERLKELVPTNSLFISNGKSGVLMFKRNVKKDFLTTKSWKARYFQIQHRILFCYRNEQEKEPLRSLLLEDCIIEDQDTKNNKYKYVFSIYNKTTNTRFLLRALDLPAFVEWKHCLQREGCRPPDPLQISPPATVVDSSTGLSIQSLVESSNRDDGSDLYRIEERDLEQLMTPGQRKRFTYFKQQKTFFNVLTEICEKLRFMEVDVRKFFLRRDVSELVIPPFSYLPLCSSTDRYRAIVNTIPHYGHAFTTKARCPALMLFEVLEHPHGIDTASFLSSELHEYSEAELLAPTRKETPPVAQDDSQALVRQGDDAMPAPLDSSTTTSKARRVSIFRVEPVQEAASHWQEGGRVMQQMLDESGQGGLQELNERCFSTSKSAGLKMDLFSAQELITAADAAEDPTASGQVREDQLNVRTPVESLAAKSTKISLQSEYAHLPGWRVDGLIAKSNDDVRQEVFVMQVIRYLQMAFQADRVPVWMHTYRILSTSKTTGLIQLIHNASSIDGIKKKDEYPGSLRLYYEQVYGPAEDKTKNKVLQKAVTEYVKSMAAYSIVTYLLAIKDRHNGNIMIDNAGRVIHIDFGFVFGIAPGKQFSMETAPFKLTAEMAAVMGGKRSAEFVEYRRLCAKALLSARKHATALIGLMEIMAFESEYPSFAYNKYAISDFRGRLMLDVPDDKVEHEVNKLIDRSYNHRGTGLYDQFQLATNGIAV